MLQQSGPGGSGNTRQPLLSKRLAEPPTKRCPPMQHRPLLTHPPTKHSPPMSDSNWPVGTLAAAFGVSEGCGGSHCSMNLQVHSSSPAGGGGEGGGGSHCSMNLQVHSSSPEGGRGRAGRAMSGGGLLVKFPPEYRPACALPLLRAGLNSAPVPALGTRAPPTVPEFLHLVPGKSSLPTPMPPSLSPCSFLP